MSVKVSKSTVKIKSLNAYISRKNIFQVALALIPIAFCIYFIKHEGYQLNEAIGLIKEASSKWLLIGLLVTILYMIVHGNMYVSSFKTLNSDVTFSSSLLLALRRSFISVFLPAGGITSLAFFNSLMEKQGVSKSKIVLASSIYSLSAFASLVLIAIPAIIILFISDNLSTSILSAFVAIFILCVFFFMLFRSFLKGGIAFRIVSKYQPKAAVFFEELKSNDYSVKYLIQTILFSFLIEICGILHVYIAMKALGFDASFKISLLGYVVATLMYAISPFMRGLGAVEFTLTLVLLKFGVPKVSAISVALLYRSFEFWLPLLTGAASFFYKRDNLLLRIFPALFTMLLGIVNIVSVLTPAVKDRLKLLSEFIPGDAIYLSNFAVIISGVLLIVLSAFLVRGQKNAWGLTLMITIISVIGHLTKAIDYEEALLGIFIIGMLIYTRRNYVVKGNRKLFNNSLAYLLAGFAFILIYGIAGYYYIDFRHFHIEFNTTQSIYYTLRTTFFFDDAILQEHTEFAHWFTYSLNVLGIAYIGSLIFILLKPAIFKHQSHESEIKDAEELVIKYGKSSLDYFKTYWDKSIYISKDKESFVSFKTAGDYAFVLETPVCFGYDKMTEVILEFEDFCEDNGLKTFYYRVDEQHLQYFEKLGKKSVFVGQEGIIDFQEFTLEGGEMKPLRNALNKMKKEGFVCKVIEPPVKEGIIQKLKAVSDEWLKEPDKKESLFSGGIFNPKEIKNQILLILEDKEEKVLAFVNIIPDYAPDEVTYDLIRKTLDAHGGVMDVLMINMIEYFKNQGKRYLNLGLVPLVGIDKAKNFPERTLKFAYENLRQMQHFKGLRFFKEKYASKWTSKYLVYESDFDLIQAPMVFSAVSKFKGLPLEKKK